MTSNLTRAETTPKSRTASRRCAVSKGSTAAVARIGWLDYWKLDEEAFDKWFEKQAYSFGAQPNWTQIAEMKRVWCVARKTLREQQ
jgi:hypothetical protein